MGRARLAGAVAIQQRLHLRDLFPMVGVQIRLLPQIILHIEQGDCVVIELIVILYIKKVLENRDDIFS